MVCKERWATEAGGYGLQKITFPHSSHPPFRLGYVHAMSSSDEAMAFMQLVRPTSKPVKPCHRRPGAARASSSESSAEDDDSCPEVECSDSDEGGSDEGSYEPSEEAGTEVSDANDSNYSDSDSTHHRSVPIPAGKRQKGAGGKGKTARKRALGQARPKKSWDRQWNKRTNEPRRKRYVKTDQERRALFLVAYDKLVIKHASSSVKKSKTLRLAAEERRETYISCWRWLRDRTLLVDAYNDVLVVSVGGRGHKKAGRGQFRSGKVRPAKYPTAEKWLFVQFKKWRSEGKRVITQHIRATMKKLVREHQ
jgi:hypothetical protein